MGAGNERIQRTPGISERATPTGTIDRAARVAAGDARAHLLPCQIWLDAGRLSRQSEGRCRTADQHDGPPGAWPKAPQATLSPASVDRSLPGDYASRRILLAWTLALLFARSRRRARVLMRHAARASLGQNRLAERAGQHLRLPCAPAAARSGAAPTRGCGQASFSRWMVRTIPADSGHPRSWQTASPLRVRARNRRRPTCA